MNLEELNAIRIFTLQRAIGSLITTHPHPDLFANDFEQATAMTQASHVVDPLVPHEVKTEALEFARELIDLARDEAARRAQQKKRFE